jgi:hypothetical protein
MRLLRVYLPTYSLFRRYYSRSPYRTDTTLPAKPPPAAVTARVEPPAHSHRAHAVTDHAILDTCITIAMKRPGAISRWEIYAELAHVSFIDDFTTNNMPLPSLHYSRHRRPRFSYFHFAAFRTFDILSHYAQRKDMRIARVLPESPISELIRKSHSRHDNSRRILPNTAFYWRLLSK